MSVFCNRLDAGFLEERDVAGSGRDVVLERPGARVLHELTRLLDAVLRRLVDVAPVRDDLLRDDNFEDRLELAIGERLLAALAQHPGDLARDARLHALAIHGAHPDGVAPRILSPSAL